MATKYDTNPLDPDFPAKAKAAADAESATQTLGYTGASTQQFPQTAPTEEQTRRFAAAGAPYGNPYNGQNIPAAYQKASVADTERARTRKVAKVGLPENIVVALPYFPWYLGLIAGIVLLALLPKSEAKARFHAAQGLAAHIGILIISSLLGLVAQVTNVASIGNMVFLLVTTILMVIFAVKAWRGHPVHIESIDGLTNWLDEKIDPKIVSGKIGGK